ncbi:unnamed protein product [Citrullus colocynthis]|uniref:Uncharacterized protein n=1 Tax=Citrullus colocynthis TaxID=252529 RepID=A0ABP0YLN8_9ROSI
MWLASVCTTIAFVSSSYIVVGRRNRWAAVLISIIGGVTMAGILGAMTYYVIKYKCVRKVRKKMKLMRNGNNSWCHLESDSEFNTKGTCVAPEDVILLLTVPIFRPSFLVDADVF